MLAHNIECFNNFNVKYQVVDKVSVYDALCVLCKDVSEIEFIEEFDEITMEQLLIDVKANKNLELCVSLIENNYTEALINMQESNRNMAMYYQSFSMIVFTLYSYLYFANYYNFGSCND